MKQRTTETREVGLCMERKPCFIKRRAIMWVGVKGEKWKKDLHKPTLDTQSLTPCRSKMNRFCFVAQHISVETSKYPQCLLLSFRFLMQFTVLICSLSVLNVYGTEQSIQCKHLQELQPLKAFTVAGLSSLSFSGFTGSKQSCLLYLQSCTLSTHTKTGEMRACTHKRMVMLAHNRDGSL